MAEGVLLVGGKGTRLHPLTLDTPKPMLPVAGTPFVAHQLARAREAGVRRLVLATSYHARVFEEYFGDGSALGLELDYVTEDTPFGTGGAIRNVGGRLRSGPDDPVLVLNGDILSGVDLAALLERHRTCGADVTLHLTRVEDPRAFGLVPTDAAGRVLAFLEKPNPEQLSTGPSGGAVTDQVNAGCYVFRRSLIDAIPADRVVSVERETFPGLLAAGAQVQGVADASYWLDVGTPATFVRGCCDLVTGQVRSPLLPGPPRDALVLPGARVAPDAKLTGGTTVGAGAEIGGRALVEGSVVFDGAVIGEDAEVRGSAVGREAVVGAASVLDGVTAGDRARIGPGNQLLGAERVWRDAVIPAGAIRFA
ncbi:MAG: sugar phosphate nucleotidyltransferase [Carbonactinosporaceae bacterium]